MTESKDKLFKAISKIPIILQNNYEMYDDAKKNFLTHPIIINYLFTSFTKSFF